MKFYKAKHAQIGKGVEATVLFHKDNGTELICVKNKFDSFEKQNPKAKECKREDADKLLKKEKIKLAIPKKKQRRKTKKMSDKDILKEIEDKKTATVNILKSEDEEGQTLTFIEEVEILNIDDFLNAE